MKTNISQYEISIVHHAGMYKAYTFSPARLWMIGKTAKEAHKRLVERIWGNGAMKEQLN